MCLEDVDIDLIIIILSFFRLLNKSGILKFGIISSIAFDSFRLIAEGQ